MDDNDLAARDALIAATVSLGYPAEFGQLIAANLRTEPYLRRMTSYLLQDRPTRPEDVADEMLAIMSDRDRWVEQQRNVYYNQKLTEWYNRPRDDEDE